MSEWVQAKKWGITMYITAEGIDLDQQSGDPDYVATVRLDTCPAFFEELTAVIEQARPLPGKGSEPGATLYMPEPIAKALYLALGGVLNKKE